ncbi:MAG TPA: hypothetical protein VEM39_00555 [Myxococcaceae bacterium]|nr:hypothetical protein [Myxococcaceae bacterium]
MKRDIHPARAVVACSQQTTDRIASGAQSWQFSVDGTAQIGDRVNVVGG